MSKRRTTTSNFGVGARESHDSSPFYERFRAPQMSTDTNVADPLPVAEPFIVGDSRHMAAIADASVALVVTSPPYFAGKQYEEEVERDGVPASYLEYLDMLTQVFAECVRTLEPGGRLAVNVANLGRKPYRSLSGDVTRILEHDLGLLLRGEIIWRKGEAAGGSCAWGSYRSAANPVLRDLTERVVIASKGRFDRALPVAERAKRGLPHRNTVSTDDFLAGAVDVWSIQPESATRVNHPAPFPVELPAQLIRMYTFADDLVLDPFMGSGSTLVAAAQLGRRYVGYDMDPSYAEIARRRVAAVSTTAAPPPTPDGDHGGLGAARQATAALLAAGFTDPKPTKRRSGAIGVDLGSVDRDGNPWLFDVAGQATTYLGGMQRTEVVWRTLGRAAALYRSRGTTPYVVLTPSIPSQPSEGMRALRAAGPEMIYDVIDLGDVAALERLATYAARGSAAGPLPGFWRAADLDPSGCRR